MSQESIELLKRAFSTYNHGFRSGDTGRFVDLVDPAVEWHAQTAGMEPVYRGREGVRRWMQEFEVDMHRWPPPVL
jgi:hypothetical protein